MIRELSQILWLYKASLSRHANHLKLWWFFWAVGSPCWSLWFSCKVCSYLSRQEVFCKYEPIKHWHHCFLIRSTLLQATCSQPLISSIRCLEVVRRCVLHALTYLKVKSAHEWPSILVLSGFRQRVLCYRKRCGQRKSPGSPSWSCIPSWARKEQVSTFIIKDPVISSVSIYHSLI